MRAAPKASLYRSEVTDAALAAVREAFARFDDWRAGRWQPHAHRRPRRARHAAAADAPGRPRHRLARDDTATILARIRAADGFPGVADAVRRALPSVRRPPGAPEPGATPGQLIARRDGAVLRATRDGALWIGHVKRPGGVKLPPPSPSPPRLPACPTARRR
jgi:putative two-component system hydrogenase maturation factor HypX/HoxX